MDMKMRGIFTEDKQISTNVGTTYENFLEMEIHYGWER